MKEPTTIPDGVAQNIASSAASLLDDATAFIENPTPQNVADLLASMRIMQHRLAKALQEVKGPSPEAAPDLSVYTAPLGHTITSAKRIEDGKFEVGIDFDDGFAIVDLSPIFARGGVFEPLRDPATFAGMRVGPHGHSLVWSGWKVGKNKDDIVLSADALWLMAHP